MNRESNPYLRRLEELAEARSKWAGSEWILNILRTETGQGTCIPTDEELLQWAQKVH